MNLIFVFVLSALFAYSDCMNLSNVSRISIRNILNNYSRITDPENYMTSVDGLGRAFSRLNELGSIKLAESLVKARRDEELSESEIVRVFHEAVRAGNTNAYSYFSNNLHSYYSTPVIYIAATNGHLNILDQEITRAPDYARLESIAKTVPDVIRARLNHVLRYFAENESLGQLEARDSLIAALETNNKEAIDYLLHKPIYLDFCGTGGRVDYKENTARKCFVNHDPVLIKAAEVGNMVVVQYYLDRNMYTTGPILKKAFHAAETNGYEEIATLINLRL